MHIDKFILPHINYIGKVLLANAEHHVMNKENIVVIQTNLNETTNKCP